MLSDIEKMLFVVLALITFGATYAGFREMWLIINRGDGRLHLDNLPARVWRALYVYVTQSTTMRARPLTSLFHLGVVWGFTYYFLVNMADGLEGFIPDYHFLEGAGLFSDAYRVIGDVLSVAVLVGVGYLLLRRFVLPQKRELEYHDNILLHPAVAAGAVRRDSLLVGGFILFHVGSRFLGQSVNIAMTGPDLLRPFATVASVIWGGASINTLVLMEHLFWWSALGSILLFTPYFPYTKHAHLFMAPFNFLTKPQRTSLGEMTPLDMEDEAKEQFGAERIEQLQQTHIVDAFACIMCNRCQDVCPAYVTGKELSPSALEINKRYMIKEQMAGLAAGEESYHPLMNWVISESAVWACTSCGACVDICPVGNEPMFDILDIRRDAVLMKAEFPAELETAFKGMERQGNPWGTSESRFAWANGMDVPTVEDNPDFDILYWVGCAPSYDTRAQSTARAMVKVLHAAGVNFAVLGEMENCTGDSARRAGNEALFFELATTNVETLNEVAPKRIVVTCPHCMQNLGKEYHQFGGDYEVVHHTELIEELIAAGKLPQNSRPQSWANVTFHDPCYLGRQNDIIEAPRNVLSSIAGAPLLEMPRNGRKSFCCGAGGAQFWKEEEHGTKSVSVERYEEARDTGADVLAVGCPFCMQMFESSKSMVANAPVVKDIVELIAEGLNTQ